MKFLDFYIRSSIHVSLNVVFLALITYCLFGISPNFSVLFFVFCSTLVGYNYTKYLFRKKAPFELQIIQIITFVSLILGIWNFFFLNFKSQILAIIIAISTILYAIPIFDGKNIRNLSGTKIYVVAFCWVATTLFLPLFQAEYSMNFEVLLSGLQRFLFVLVLILIFEIIDLKEDKHNLKKDKVIYFNSKNVPCHGSKIHLSALR